MTLSWPAISILVALAVHFVYFVWRDGRRHEKENQLVEAVKQINVELKDRDGQIIAAFKKIDTIHDRLLRVEFIQENQGCRPKIKE